MTVEINADRTAAVDRKTKWIPIDENTPRGVKLQLINRAYGVALYGKHDPKDKFFTHYFPLPTFEKDL